jgi:hypothetical protein
MRGDALKDKTTIGLLRNFSSGQKFKTTAMQFLIIQRGVNMINKFGQLGAIKTHWFATRYLSVVTAH